MENSSQRMRERRTDVCGGLRYRYDGDQCGKAQWVDVSRVGAKLRLGRYLRPGRTLHLEFASPLVEEASVLLPARVLWCLQAPETAEFLAGVYVHRERPDFAVAFAALAYTSLDDSVNIVTGSEVSSGVWPDFRTLETAGLEQAAGIRQAV